MLKVLREHVAQLDLADFAEPDLDTIDPDVLGRLQALGYVDSLEKSDEVLRNQ
jgi:hypothetical protein